VVVISGQQVRSRRPTQVDQTGLIPQDPHMVLVALGIATDIREVTGDLDMAHTG
jgi:hypothetical protein